MSDLLLRRGDCFQHFEIWQKRQLVSFEIFCWHSQKKKDPYDLFSSNMYKGCKRLKCSKPMSFSQVFLKNEQMISVSLIPFFFFFVQPKINMLLFSAEVQIGWGENTIYFPVNLFHLFNNEFFVVNVKRLSTKDHFHRKKISFFFIRSLGSFLQRFCCTVPAVKRSHSITNYPL